MIIVPFLFVIPRKNGGSCIYQMSYPFFIIPFIYSIIIFENFIYHLLIVIMMIEELLIIIGG